MSAQELKIGSQLAVPLDQGLINECARRSGDHTFNLTALLERLLVVYLDSKPQGDLDWELHEVSAALVAARDEVLKKCGSPSEGYQWQSLFLPNGTRLKMKYKGKEHIAEVRYSQVMYEDIAYSPSEWVSHVANNTARNAWRDVWVQPLGEGPFHFADTLRKQGGKR